MSSGYQCPLCRRESFAAGELQIADAAVSQGWGVLAKPSGDVDDEGLESATMCSVLILFSTSKRARAMHI